MDVQFDGLRSGHKIFFPIVQISTFILLEQNCDVLYLTCKCPLCPELILMQWTNLKSVVLCISNKKKATLAKIVSDGFVYA